MGQILFGLTWGMILFFGLRKRSARLKERGRAPTLPPWHGANLAATLQPSTVTTWGYFNSTGASGAAAATSPIRASTSAPPTPFGSATAGSPGPAPLAETFADKIAKAHAARRAGKQMRGERVGP